MDKKQGLNMPKEEDVAELERLEAKMVQDLGDVRERLFAARVLMDETNRASQVNIMHEISEEVAVVELRRMIGEYAAPMLLVEDAKMEDVLQIPFVERRSGIVRFTHLTWNEMPRAFMVTLSACGGAIQFELWTADCANLCQPLQLLTQTIVAPTGLENIECKISCQFNPASGQLLFYPDSTKAKFDSNTGQLRRNLDGTRREVFIGPSLKHQHLVIINRSQPQNVAIHIDFLNH